MVAAIDAAGETGIPLRIAGIIQDEEYFKREIAPRLDGDRVRFVGPVRAEDRSSFLGGAMALLHLIDFDEPFGLSVVEAMACGTPVIAFDRGSMSEIISDGTTGSLVADVGIGGRSDRACRPARPAEQFETWRSDDSAATAWSTSTSPSIDMQSPNLRGDHRVGRSSHLLRDLAQSDLPHDLQSGQSSMNPSPP